MSADVRVRKSVLLCLLSFQNSGQMRKGVNKERGFKRDLQR